MSEKALEARPDLLFSLNEMEKTGGKPDLIAVEGTTYVFADLSGESPESRRDLDYDQAKAMADAMGVTMMDEAAYRELQARIPLDAETFSWLLTDAKTRASGNALNGNRNGDNVNVNEDFADNRNPDKGWRGLIRVFKLVSRKMNKVSSIGRVRDSGDSLDPKKPFRIPCRDQLDLVQRYAFNLRDRVRHVHHKGRLVALSAVRMGRQVGRVGFEHDPVERRGFDDIAQGVIFRIRENARKGKHEAKIQQFFSFNRVTAETVRHGILKAGFF
ncbi:DUF4256 domain-containing protein [Candidatus Peregrinibacteria bacterium]|nr:DUF4256 domain-containing protein [Candidatus Peregrinibacteria bacterium]